MSAKRNPIIDVDPFGPPLLNNMKKKAALPITAPEIHDTNFNGEKKVLEKNFENEVNLKRPKTAAPKTKSRKPKSKSPKRVHISTDPKDLPTNTSKENNEIKKSEDIENSIYSNDSFIEEDILNLFD